MPLYSYVCFKCGNKQEVVKPMKLSDKLELCNICGSKIYRDYQTDCVNTANKDYNKPIVSQSLAINPNQIAEHNQMFPDIKVTPDGCPVFENYAQHEKYLNATGFVKHPQKIRLKGKRIKAKTS